MYKLTHWPGCFGAILRHNCLHEVALQGRLVAASKIPPYRFTPWTISATGLKGGGCACQMKAGLVLGMSPFLRWPPVSGYRRIHTARAPTLAGQASTVLRWLLKSPDSRLFTITISLCVHAREGSHTRHEQFHTHISQASKKGKPLINTYS